jgi:hypothetical protein
MLLSCHYVHSKRRSFPKKDASSLLLFSVLGIIFFPLHTHAFVLMTRLCRDEQAKSRKQERAYAEPEGQGVLMQGIIEPPCDEWSQSRTQRDRNSLHRRNCAIARRPT